MRRRGWILCVGIVALLAGCFGPRENLPPVLIVEVLPPEGYTPLPVTLDASASFDPGGRSLTIRWDFDDGSSAIGAVVVHSFRTPGVHEVRVTATDRTGTSTSEILYVHAHAVPEGHFVQRFSWERDGEPRTWEILIPYDLYQMYKGRLRVPFVDNYAYGDYVSDPLDDPTLADYATSLWYRAGQDDGEFILETLAFVQGAIQYRPDPPGTEHPLYPLETLADAAGDCEDTAILLVSLIQARDIPCKLAFVDSSGSGIPDHVLAFVAVPESLLPLLPCAPDTTVFLWEGQTFVLAETALDEEYLGLGCDPWGIDEGDIYEMWSFPEAFPGG